MLSIKSWQNRAISLFWPDIFSGLQSAGWTLVVENRVEAMNQLELYRVSI